ncbi:MAG TPA: hypothetical protein DCX25_00150 [Candidatus Pacebacteria bacterium]|nr:MAG: hypothetical protein UX00_C0003G0016 [Microgenomates group bacterium GW2011_GWB1_45_17]KKU24178.1 MAG: hypothetical protein UX36_C0002G0161 [Microgenomates group bacterium GW2011_GWC1_46_15]KKU24893.1 MAG: hypothetical protein UX35_C0001G0075 [Microgenomates group bacterium GW2011_GWA1_46_15]HAV14732.1 hypothetical protein [Candidatus Paceibacterota bacterium]HCR92707.1 hypothetical protein [Candidatus Paceibacterota bacterium]
MGKGDILEQLNAAHTGEGIIQTAHGPIHEFVMKDWGGTPEQATYTRYLGGIIWSPGFYSTILTGMEEAMLAAELNEITLDQLEELRELARLQWSKNGERNPDRPADTEETARAMQLKVLSPLDFRHT